MKTTIIISLLFTCFTLQAQSLYFDKPDSTFQRQRKNEHYYNDMKKLIISTDVVRTEKVVRTIDTLDTEVLSVIFSDEAKDMQMYSYRMERLDTMSYYHTVSLGKTSLDSYTMNFKEFKPIKYYYAKKDPAGIVFISAEIKAPGKINIEIVLWFVALSIVILIQAIFLFVMLRRRLKKGINLQLSNLEEKGEVYDLLAVSINIIILLAVWCSENPLFMWTAYTALGLFFIIRIYLLFRTSYMRQKNKIKKLFSNLNLQAFEKTNNEDSYRLKNSYYYDEDKKGIIILHKFSLFTEPTSPTKADQRTLLVVDLKPSSKNRCKLTCFGRDGENHVMTFNKKEFKQVTSIIFSYVNQLDLANKESLESSVKQAFENIIV